MAVSKVSVDSCNRSVSFEKELKMVYTGISGWKTLDKEMRDE